MVHLSQRISSGSQWDIPLFRADTNLSFHGSNLKIRAVHGSLSTDAMELWGTNLAFCICYHHTQGLVNVDSRDEAGKDQEGRDGLKVPHKSSVPKKKKEYRHLRTLLTI